MPYMSTPGNTGRSLKEALDALMSQGPEQAEAPVQFPTPAPPTTPSQFSPDPLQLPEPPPTTGSSARGMVQGDWNPPPESPSPFAGVSRQNAAQGLAGLQAAQGNQFSPFGEGELHQMASRDPRTVAPGSNEMWAGKHKEMQGNRLQSEGLQRKALEGIHGAIQGTHPAVQFQQEQTARRSAMPETIRAQGQFRSAQETANSRRYAAEASADSSLAGREFNSKAGMADTVMQAIRAIRAKTGGLQGDDAVQLRALENLYSMLSEPLTGATFEEAYDPDASEEQ